MVEMTEKTKVSLGKQLILGELEKSLAQSEHVFFSRFDRLSVADISELRRNLEKVSRRTLLVKHTLAKKALKKLELSEAARFLEGSILVTLGEGEPQAISRTLVEFVKGHENVELKGLVLDGKIYEANSIKELAKLPPRHELLTRVATGMKAPIANFTLTLAALLRSLVTVLEEVRKQKESIKA